MISNDKRSFRQLGILSINIAAKTESVGNVEEWKAWKAIKPASHPSHSPWKSLRDSHIPNASTTGSILISDRACPAFTQNQSCFPRKGLVNSLPGTKRKASPGALTSALLFLLLFFASQGRVRVGAPVFRDGVAGRNRPAEVGGGRRGTWLETGEECNSSL